MQIKFELLKNGDTVLNTWENHIAIRRKSGDVEIFQYYLDENGLPRISANTVLITKGNGAVSSVSEDGAIEIMTI